VRCVGELFSVDARLELGAVLAEMFQSTPLELDRLWLEIKAFLAAS
jgi:hypothetical protein